ncbi:MAG TPA: GAF domain-containing protein [Pyrinomonadaceae bacterium]|nr:GAF domain-containing protein [Pyrinomonadaceae bacterium]
MRAELPADEGARLEALRQFKVLDSEHEEAFDAATRLAVLICQTPTALITFVDEDRQWFKSRVGFDEQETTRDVSFCAHAILQPGPLVVRDTQTDERFRDNPFVLRSPYIRFYAGAPLTTDEGHKLGTLCVLDTVPRVLFADQLDALELLSTQIMALLNMRRTVGYLETALNRKRETIAQLEEQLRRSGGPEVTR